MVNFRFDDQKDIEAKITVGYANQETPEETIRELARYNYHILGLNKEDNYDAILRYMTHNCTGFYEENYFKTIYRNIDSAKKYKFRKISTVNITKTEMDTIMSLGNIREEKIAFVLLAVAKYYNNVSENNNNRLYLSNSDLFKLARVSIVREERPKLLQSMYQKGILAIHTFVGTNLKIVNFVDDESEVALQLNEFDYKELAYTYLNYKNGGYKRCKQCGKWFKKFKNKPNQQYCRDCGQKEEVSEVKVRQCVDCSSDFVVNKFDTKSFRCSECQDIIDKENARKRIQKFRENQQK